MMIVYNLEKFCIDEILRPYMATLDERTWLVHYKKETLTQEQIEEWSKLQDRYEKNIYRVDGFNRLINMLERRKDWSEQVFNRLKNIKFTFYKYLDQNNVLIKYVNQKLQELRGGEWEK